MAVCCQWTPETTNLINADRLAAMKRGVVLVNVARGEIVDEAALAEALARGHLRAVVLDVYVGEFDAYRSHRPRIDQRRGFPARIDALCCRRLRAASARSGQGTSPTR